ncbi:putative phospholipase C [Burkholderia cenocepacia]|nr:putative phospholipase C [Burkholderia cenocepacia]
MPLPHHVDVICAPWTGRRPDRHAPAACADILLRASRARGDQDRDNGRRLRTHTHRRPRNGDDADRRVSPRGVRRPDERVQLPRAEPRAAADARGPRDEERRRRAERRAAGRPEDRAAGRTVTARAGRRRAPVARAAVRAACARASGRTQRHRHAEVREHRPRGGKIPRLRQAAPRPRAAPLRRRAGQGAERQSRTRRQIRPVGARPRTVITAASPATSPGSPAHVRRIRKSASTTRAQAATCICGCATTAVAPSASR